MDANVDEAYLPSRRCLGETHARFGLPLITYFASMNMFLEVFLKILNDSKLKDDVCVASSESIGKLLHLDTAVVVETYNRIPPGQSDYVRKAVGVLAKSGKVKESQANDLLEKTGS